MRPTEFAEYVPRWSRSQGELDASNWTFPFTIDSEETAPSACLANKAHANEYAIPTLEWTDESIREILPNSILHGYFLT